ncbi:hypothetical protein HMPREF9440_01302 [Sutterella parvirubra YIT 11816]|uniref:Uncharacterized protein n=1 Tax=Sutterella parvirubra YIT 11816 TaxID=762967 RepID=H3KEY7_9BURK|nr:hypothetical protein HMPREF9440_01302 [Sutterella parvirubra YIT 11816]
MTDAARMPEGAPREYPQKPREKENARPTRRNHRDPRLSMN